MITKLLLSALLGMTLIGCGAPESNEHQHHVAGIGEHDRCHMCGMMIKKYPGPKGELVLKSGELTPKFCSTRDMFTFALQPENQRQISRLLVHDMAVTDWDNPQDSHFIDATQAWYVYGTSRQAVMGSALAPFSSEAAAQKFAQQYGGAVLRYDQIDLTLLGE